MEDLYINCTFDGTPVLVFKCNDGDFGVMHLGKISYHDLESARQLHEWLGRYLEQQ